MGQHPGGFVEQTLFQEGLVQTEGALAGTEAETLHVEADVPNNQANRYGDGLGGNILFLPHTSCTMITCWMKGCLQRTTHCEPAGAAAINTRTNSVAGVLGLDYP